MRFSRRVGDASRIALKLRRAEERFIPYSTRAASFKRLLGDDAIVLGMGANPKPQDAIRYINGQRAIVCAHSYRVEPTCALEME